MARKASTSSSTKITNKSNQSVLVAEPGRCRTVPVVAFEKGTLLVTHRGRGGVVGVAGVRRRLGVDDGWADDDVADETELAVTGRIGIERERQHVGGSVDVSMVSIQLGDLVAIDERQRELVVATLGA